MTILSLALAVLLGMPPMYMAHALIYRIHGHRIKVSLRRKTLVIETKNPKYTMEIKHSKTRWRIIIRTNYVQDPFL